VGELRTELAVRLELRRDRFRAAAEVWGSDHPGASWPDAPPVARPEPTPAAAPDAPPPAAAAPAPDPTPEEVVAA
jgi:hypothetical protein